MANDRRYKNTNYSLQHRFTEVAYLELKEKSHFTPSERSSDFVHMARRSAK